MEQIIYLDLLTLIKSLGQESAYLRTDLPKGIPGIAQAGIGTVFIRKQSVVECVIETSSGIRIEGERAFQILKSIKGWYITLEKHMPASMSEPFPQQPPAPLSSAPIFVPLTQQLALEQFNDLSAKDRLLVRMVFVKIDGHKNIDQIKRELSLPSETVDQVISYLLQMKVIEART